MVGGCSELLQVPETMTFLVSRGTVGHWAFAESSRENIRDSAVGLCRSQTRLDGGVVVA